MRCGRKYATIVFVISIIIYVAVHHYFFMHKGTKYFMRKFEALKSSSSDSQYQYNNYTPRYNILFLKTHKCASTTVQNILMRFGLRHSLNFVLPKKNNYLNYFENFSESLLAPDTKTKDGKYNILAHHTRYSSTLKNIMHPDTVLVTILRDPAIVFESVFHYYHFNKRYKISFQDLLNIKPMSKVLEIINKGHNKRRKLGYNQMSRDLGLSESSFKNVTEIEKFIEKIDKEFDYVMIAEYIDESLVLLAKLMKWPLDYVSYLPLNSRQSGDKYNLSNTDKLKLKSLNYADTLLYNHFVKKFENLIQQYDAESLSRDVRQLKEYNHQLTHKCVSKENTKMYGKTIGYDLKNLSDWDCVYSTKSELRFTEELRVFQAKRLHARMETGHL